jgi:hypothetical protein
MVQITKEEMRIVDKFQFFDKYGKLPEEKVRIDITISKEALEKLKGMNRSSVINELVINQL